MHWCKGLIAVLMMSLLACVVVRAQQPLPWGPGTLPLAPPAEPIAHPLSEAPETPLPLAAPRDAEGGIPRLCHSSTDGNSTSSRARRRPRSCAVAQH